MKKSIYRVSIFGLFAIGSAIVGCEGEYVCPNGTSPFYIKNTTGEEIYVVYREAPAKPVYIQHGHSAQLSENQAGFNLTIYGAQSGALRYQETLQTSCNSLKTLEVQKDAIVSYPLNLQILGPGTGKVLSEPAYAANDLEPSVLINCTSDCTTQLRPDSMVTLRAESGSDSHFGGWSGIDDCTGSTPECTTTMDKTRKLTAVFLKNSETHSLYIAFKGDGTGRVQSTPQGADCTKDCSADFVVGTAVVLSASPGEGSVFMGWEGACSGQADCSIAQVESSSSMLVARFEKLEVRQASMGYSHACALLNDHGIRCWGTNGSGELGTLTTGVSSNYPISAKLNRAATGVSVGSGFSCALMADQTVSCWGANFAGQSGATPAPSQVRPQQISGVAGAVAISAGFSHACAVTQDGKVYCWGSGSFGELGNGQRNDSATGLEVIGLPQKALQVSTGSHHSCALVADGSVHCWGDNSVAQLGNALAGTQSSTPLLVKGLEAGVLAISTGGYHGCALFLDQSFACWGNNSAGQLGVSSVPLTSYPLKAKAISAGHSHTCAVATDGSTSCWGSNSSGQLGQSIPAALNISAGVESTCAQTQDNGLSCWGQNNHGQLGDGTRSSRTNAAPVVWK